MACYRAIPVGNETGLVVPLWKQWVNRTILHWCPFDIQFLIGLRIFIINEESVTIP